MKLIVFDTETTGLIQKIQIYIVKNLTTPISFNLTG